MMIVEYENTETGLGKPGSAGPRAHPGARHSSKPTNVSDLKARFVIQYRRLRDLAYYLEVVVVVVLSIIAAVRD
jgi:hypothetical protein